MKTNTFATINDMFCCFRPDVAAFVALAPVAVFEGV